jgi:hypothetical protein
MARAARRRHLVDAGADAGAYHSGRLFRGALKEITNLPIYLKSRIAAVESLN